MRGVTCLFYAAVSYFVSTIVGAVVPTAANSLIGLIATIFFIGAAAAYGFTDKAGPKTPSLLDQARGRGAEATNTPE